VESVEIPLETVRRLALHCQGLDGARPVAPGKEGVAGVIERLGYVQIDTIHVIQRAHHHVLWSRCPDYAPDMLHALLAEDRAVFEWWTHAASYIPMSDFRFYAPRMGERMLSDRQKAWRDEHREVFDAVMQRIREEGALGTADFEAPEGFRGGTWWNGWKPAKRALDVLFDLGEVAVSERRNFQRIYDLRERVIPEGADVPAPDRAEIQDYVIRRSVGSLGALPEKEIRWWGRTRATETALQHAVEAGLITPVRVEGRGDEPWYAWTEALGAVDGSPVSPPRLHTLSPFDNLIIRRYWLEPVFGFRYRLECYTPSNKRQYGYFALPILWGDRFVGRVDTKADRSTGTLLVRQLTFESDFDAYDDVLPALARELQAFAAFNGCESVAVEMVSPEAPHVPLVTALEREGG
jgi:uncharacterized protein